MHARTAGFRSVCRLTAPAALFFYGALAAQEPVPPPKAEPTVRELVDKAANRNLMSQERAEAVQKLGALKTLAEVKGNNVVDELKRIVTNRDDDWRVRRQAVRALGMLQYHVFQDDGYAKARFLEPFGSIIRDENDEEFVRADAITALGRCIKSDQPQEERLVAAIKGLLADRNAPVLLRCAAAEALGNMREAGMIEVFIRVLEEINLPSVLRDKVLDAITRLIDPSIKLPAQFLLRLKRIVEDKTFPLKLRLDVVRLFARLGSKGLTGSGVDFLAVCRRLLDEKTDKDYAEIARTAVEQIGVYGDEKGLEVLQGLLKRTDLGDAGPQLRPAIMRSLGSMLQSLRRGKEAVNISIRLVEDVVKTLLKTLKDYRGEAETLNAAVFSFGYLVDFNTKSLPASIRDPAKRLSGRVSLELLTLVNDKIGDSARIFEILADINRIPNQGAEIRYWVEEFAKIYPDLKDEFLKLRAGATAPPPVPGTTAPATQPPATPVPIGPVPIRPGTPAPIAPPATPVPIGPGTVVPPPGTVAPVPIAPAVPPPLTTGTVAPAPIRP